SSATPSVVTGEAMFTPSLVALCTRAWMAWAPARSLLLRTRRPLRKRTGVSALSRRTTSAPSLALPRLRPAALLTLRPAL
nr:hypothetical protein [Tanacetum cinerariifolium]